MRLWATRDVTVRFGPVRFAVGPGPGHCRHCHDAVLSSVAGGTARYGGVQ